MSAITVVHNNTLNVDYLQHIKHNIHTIECIINVMYEFLFVLNTIIQLKQIDKKTTSR